MALDFPDHPTVGEIFQHWEWDGSKWASLAHHWSPPEAPIDHKTYGRKDGEWEPVLNLEDGGTVEKDLTIDQDLIVHGRSEFGTSLPAGNIAVEIARDLQVMGRTYVHPAPTANNEAASKIYVDNEFLKRRYVETITGNGSTLHFGIPHSFNTNAVVVSIWDVATEYMVLADVSIVNANTIDISFTDPPATGKAYRVVVVS